jgi:hypothetical protein
MAVTRVFEDWKALAVDTEVNLDGASGSMVRRFGVEFNTADATASRPILALTASSGGVSIPDYWDAHPASSDYFVRKKTVAPGDGPFMWYVTVGYEYIENPLLQPYSVQFIPQGTQEAIDKAFDPVAQTFTKELANSSKEPFDPPIQEEFFDFSILITRNEANFNITYANAYLNTVNSDTFMFFARNGVGYQFAAGKARCKSIQASEQRHGAAWYWQVQYEFIVRQDGWLRRVLDQGFRELDGSDYVQIADTEGNPVTQPVKLNGSGVKLAASADPVFLEFQTKKTINFSFFNF